MGAEATVPTRQNDSPAASPACPVCGELPDPLLLVPDPLNSDRLFTLLRCPGCGLALTHPHLQSQDLEQYYDDDYWHQPSHSRTKLVTQLQHWFVELRLHFSLRTLRLLVPTGSKVLDIGCGCGDLLQLLRKAGYQCGGVEISQAAAASCHGKSTEPVFCGTLHEAAYPDNTYDAVMLLHVLEHLDNPQEVLHEIRRILCPGGVLVIEVPNLDGLGFSLFGHRWHPLDIPLHQLHFSPRSLDRMLGTAGFATIRLSHLSLRASCAAWVVSLLPCLSPRRLRTCRSPARRLAASLLYLLLQLCAVPLVLAAALLRRGETIIAAAVAVP